MKATTFFGYKCPRCGSKVNVGISVGGGTVNCPDCGASMVPDEAGQASAANVYCPHCNAAFGLVTSDRCPTCGGPLSKMP